MVIQRGHSAWLTMQRGQESVVKQRGDAAYVVMQRGEERLLTVGWPIQSQYKAVCRCFGTEHFLVCELL